MNYLNSIRFVGTVIEKIAILIWGVIWKAPVLGALMFKFTGHRPIMDKLSSTEHE
jgi:hypothetical protein